MLTINNTGLIIVDIQGKLARLVHDSDMLIANCEKLIKGAAILNLPIIQLEQNPDKLGSTVGELNAHLSSCSPISKFTFNACDTIEFVEALEATKIQHWLICGIETHICVYQTARGLIEQGINVEVVSDCVSSRTPDNKQLGLERVRDCGGKITALEMCLYEIVQDCRKDEFKQILKLIR